MQNLHRQTEQTLAGQIRAAARLALASLQKPSTPVVTEPDPGGRRPGTWP